METTEAKMHELMFYQLVMSLTDSAMIQLGKLVNPATGKTEVNLAHARATIDVLRMLKEKTQGNLNPNESRLMEQTVLTLQLNYAEEAEKKPAEGQAPESPSGAPASAPRPEA